MKNFKTTDFKIGDKVKIIKESWFKKTDLENKTAIVIFISDECIGVQFPFEFFGAHSCDGFGKKGQCLYLYPYRDIIQKAIPTQLELF